MVIPYVDTRLCRQALHVFFGYMYLSQCQMLPSRLINSATNSRPLGVGHAALRLLQLAVAQQQIKLQPCAYASNNICFQTPSHHHHHTTHERLNVQPRSLTNFH